MPWFSMSWTLASTGAPDSTLHVLGPDAEGVGALAAARLPPSGSSKVLGATTALPPASVPGEQVDRGRADEARDEGVARVVVDLVTACRPG